MLLTEYCKESDKYDYSYYGKDAEEFLKSIGFKNDVKYLGKECATSYNKQGIIIGVKDSNTYMSYFYIVYIPELCRVCYEYLESKFFIKSIII